MHFFKLNRKHLRHFFLLKKHTAELLMLLALLFSSIGFAQKGPGGVSNEIVGDSDCKMWLDAEELPLIDGASVASWLDISLSVNPNTPTQANLPSQPTYRSDPSESINGHPILRFLPSKFLQLLSSSDINTSGPYTSRTTFLAFRTGSDVTTRQMLWEQGGNVRGLNIFIFNGDLYFGGYDVANDPDGTPVWNYTFTRVPISPSTPYVVTHVFEGPLGATTGTISGYLNGQTFALLNPGPGDPAANVGSLWSHPNAPGLGAVNGDSYNELGPISGATGQQPFLGDMAEFVAYERILNDAERIIVENYLGAKYFANLVVNDYFDFQVTHGKEVIGIGRDVGAANFHNTSQGRNLFEIEGNTANFGNADLEYFLIGHDQGDLSAWTVTNAPNNGISTLRISREWKVDHTGDVGDVTFTLDAADLPALPAIFTKYCLVVDKSGGPVSDFNSGNTEIIEMVNTSGTIYETAEPIPDGSYVTIAIVDPKIQFTNAVDFGFELSPAGTDNAVSIDVELNYRPAANITVDYTFADNTAIFGAGPPPGVDYFNMAPVSGFLTITPGNYTDQITFDILGDLDPEVTEDLNLSLFLGGNTSPILDLGVNSANVFTIFDDDNTPKVGFSAISSSHIENAGTVNIQIVRTGNNFPAVSVDYQLRIIGGSGTATNTVDYTYASGTANFPSGVTSVNMPLNILDDLLDEPNETVIFELLNNVNCDILPGFIEHTATIVDNDSPPTIQYVITASQGPETTGAPIIEIQLSGPSSQIVQIDYVDLLSGSATAVADYTIASTGTITFIPGDTIETLPLFFVINDVIAEPDETINLAFVGGSQVNCTPLGNLSHQYTIKDYSSFEWTGAAGVGMAIDNILWLNSFELTNADGTNVQDFIDISPNANVVSQLVQANQPNISFSGPNGKKELVFNGTSDIMDISDNANINTAPFYNGKHISLAITTGNNVATRQMIYEQGGGTRGLCVYIEGNEMYYHIWSNANDNGANSAWGVGSTTGAFFVSSGSGSILPNTDYIISFNYAVNSPTGLLEGFINGQSAGSIVTSTPSGVDPRLYVHGDNGGLGGVIGSTRYHDNASGNNYFQGAIQEVIHFSDAPVNTTRRIIVENHLSTKYDVALFVPVQYYSASYALSHENEMAGLGQFGASDNHSDAQGTGMVRINTPSSLDNGDFLLWGHDGASLTVGLLPYVELIPGIPNRLHRVWKASELGGDVGTVTVTFYLGVLAGFATFVQNDLVLLIDSDDGDFTNCTQIEAGRTYNPLTGELTFTAVNFNNDQWFTVGTKSWGNPLPIDLLSFTATAVNDKVRLDWATATETENKHFTVERSRDGINWVDISTIEGAGNSTQNLYYQNWDFNPEIGLSYYRLRQTDFNDDFTYSQIRSVVFSSNIDYLLYPNPSNGDINLYLSGDEVDLIIYDMQGKIILEQRGISGEVHSFSLSSFESGVYVARIIHQGLTYIKEIVLK
ncbi:MAG: hypothetical protein ACI857_001185 [Arenicella sp.]